MNDLMSIGIHRVDHRHQEQQIREDGNSFTPEQAAFQSANEDWRSVVFSLSSTTYKARVTRLKLIEGCEETVRNRIIWTMKREVKR